jgi:tetratricopeptide (TPR) repeat protein
MVYLPSAPITRTGRYSIYAGASFLLVGLLFAQQPPVVHQTPTTSAVVPTPTSTTQVDPENIGYAGALQIIRHESEAPGGPTTASSSLRSDAVQVARSAIRSGHYGEALAALTDQGLDNDELSDYYRSLARCALRDYDGALADAGRLLSRLPNSPRGHIARSIVYLASGGYDAAIQESTQSSTIESGTSIGYVVQGFAYRGLGQLQNANTAFRAAISLARLIDSRPDHDAANVAPSGANEARPSLPSANTDINRIHMNDGRSAYGMTRKADRGVATGSCWRDADSPVSQSTTVYSLLGVPTPPASLMLTRNGLVLRQNSDYSVAGSQITFVETAAPQPTDILQAWYRVCDPDTAATGAGLAVTTTALPNGQAGTPYAYALTAAGGIKPYTWSLISGTLPNPLTLTSATGLISGTPSAAAQNISLSFKVTDSSAPVQTATTTLTLTIVAAAMPASITATSGGGQSTNINAAFSSPLTATVRDAGSNPMSGVTVTFAAPLSGPSGTFAGGGIAATALTNSSGVATSPVFTANGTAGGCVVTASVAGVSTSASFALTNTSRLAIILPTSVSIMVDDRVPVSVSISSPTMTGVSIMLTSSDPTVVNVSPPNLFMFPGQTANTVQITGLGSGTAAIKASGFSFPSATMQVQVGNRK